MNANENRRPLAADPFEAFRDARKDSAERARREAMARGLETGTLRLMGTDAKGRPVQLGTPALRMAR